MLFLIFFCALPVLKEQRSYAVKCLFSCYMKIHQDSEPCIGRHMSVSCSMLTACLRYRQCEQCTMDVIVLVHVVLTEEITVVVHVEVVMMVAVLVPSMAPRVAL